MKITIAGKAGSGKSVVSERLAKDLGYKHYSTGDFWREIASEMGMDVLTLNKYAETHEEIDHKMDDRQKKLGETEDDFVIDGRLSWHFVPDSVKIFLDVKDEVGAERILGDKTRTTEGYHDVKDAVVKLHERRDSEKKRYGDLYGIDPYDVSNYDIVVDTTSLTIEEVVAEVKKEIEKLK
jgi:predicted cytidylate kinase